MAISAPEENWGEPSAGMQMSIRLEKPTYKVGEPIDAIITMRNLDLKPKEYMVVLPFETGFGLSLFGAGQPAPMPTMAESRATNAFEKRLTKLVVGGNKFALLPSEHRKHEFRLEKIYDLTRPGSYQIMASREIDDPDTGGKTLISTKSASFEIVSGNSPDIRTNVSSIGFQGSPVMPTTEARQTGAAPVTSFHSKTGLLQTSEANKAPRPLAAPSLAEAGSTSSHAEKGWTWGILFAAIAAFVGSIVWVLRRRGGGS